MINHLPILFSRIFLPFYDCPSVYIIIEKEYEWIYSGQSSFVEFSMDTYESKILQLSFYSISFNSHSSPNFRLISSRNFYSRMYIFKKEREKSTIGIPKRLRTTDNSRSLFTCHFLQSFKSETCFSLIDSHNRFRGSKIHALHCARDKLNLERDEISGEGDFISARFVVRR